MNSVEKHKLGIRYEMQKDIDKLDHAIGLLNEVQEGLAEAFHNHLENENHVPSTNSTTGTAPMKMARAINDIKNIQHAMKIAKEKI